MPGTIRARSGRILAGPRPRGFQIAAAATLLAIGSCAQASALDFSTLAAAKPYAAALSHLEHREIVGLSLTFGVVFFAVVSAIGFIRTRTRAARMDAKARSEISSLRDRVDRAHALLLSEPQIVITWPAAAEEPELFGDMAIVAASSAPHRALAFGTWLSAEQAAVMEEAVELLRSNGEGFAMAATTLAGRYVEIEGRAIGGRAMLRIKDLSGTRQDLIDLTIRHEKLKHDIDALRSLIEALPSPIWARDAAGNLTYINPAYAFAVDGRSHADVVERRLELLDPRARESMKLSRLAGESYSARLPVIVAGDRRIFDVFDIPTHSGSAGIGIDVSEVELLRDEIARKVEAHRRTLDQLPSAVAIFAADQRLAFYNAAYRVLWGLNTDFLDRSPTDSAVLDHLRAARKLPEQADFRSWKTQLLDAYRAIEPQTHLWHLPDGRTLRVVTTPNPEGGVTYLFDNVTERLELERRHDALIRVQGETLDNLSEGVAVFSSDGRLRLSNPSFARMWKLSASMLTERPHIEATIAACQPLHSDDTFWQSLRGAVTGLERREPMNCRLDRSDGSVIECATMPLPDGATLLTFQDISDSVNVERVLRERNDALETADHLKNDFIQHVSYELRSPLTNIIGFAQLLDDAALTGPLTDKQHEYLGYITTSSSALLAIINDILDLATIDAGAMMLDLRTIDIRSTMEAAAEGVRDRLTEQNLLLDIDAARNIGAFVADERRVRQILFKLLSNAISFSPPGETITLAAERRDDAVLFSVTDRGPGIPVEIQDRVFSRFETHTHGSRHRGTGLGLSIVRSFVELHGGTVSLESVVGHGTTVTCVFPIEHVMERAAAE
ncbi:MAG TPA: PAS-domain containing protein [Xanthobacteraceae bacterium]|jgi:signal transduction histidine kinase|nr:PAS-domain containing protein [Xanthobacteraceae bacterium]